MTALSQLEDLDRNRLVQVCASAQCQLLLGAGASLDSHGADGRGIPGTQELARELELEFDLAITEISLREVADKLVRRELANDLYAYLHRRLTQSTPSGWYQQLVELAWRRIWTLNVDDVVEQAYLKWRPQAAQQIQSYSFAESFREDGRRLQVVHLHGSARSPEPSDLVFALIEYVESARTSRTWTSVFGDLWMEKPFIVIGASLRDEYDLERFFGFRNKPASQLGLYVSRSITEEWEQELRLLGLTPVRSTAADFIEELHAQVKPLQERRLGKTGVSHRDRESLLHFGQHFRNLLDVHGAEGGGAHDLLAGEHATLEDVQSGKDILLSHAAEMSKAITARVSDERFGFLLLSGSPFSGKTVALMRAALSVAGTGVQTFWFRGESKPNVSLIAEALATLGGPVVILVDDLAPWAGTFADIVLAADRKGVALVVGATCRERRLKVVVGAIPYVAWDVRQDLYYTDPLSERDAQQIDSYLDRIGRLNYIQGTAPRQRVKMFQRDGVFAGLYRAHQGTDFRKRVAELYDSALDGPGKALALIGGVLAQANLPLTTSVAWSIIHRSAAFDPPGPLSEVFEVSGEHVLVRHRDIALRHLRVSLGKDGTRDALWKVLSGLRRSVNEATIRSGSSNSEILKALLRSRTLRDLVGPDRSTALFEDLEDLYGWDGGFWEQRALNSRASRRWPEAEGFAAKAVSMIDDPRRNTTLGTILLARLAEDKKLHPDEVDAVLSRAIATFDAAIAGARPTPFPILRCLQGIEAVASRRGAEFPDSTVVRLQTLWASWYAKGRSIEGFAIGELAKELETERDRWDGTIGRLLSPSNAAGVSRPNRRPGRGPQRKS